MRYWKDIVFDMWRIIERQHGDLYDEEFEMLVKYIEHLDDESGDCSTVEFETEQWKSATKFLQDICQEVYYVSRENMVEEVEEVIAYCSK